MDMIELGGGKFSEKDIVAYVLKKSLYEFVKHFWNSIESMEYVDNWHIRVVCEHLQAVTEGKIKRLIINIPPGTGKSLLTSVLWPAWEWSRDPSTRWFFASYDQQLSTRDSLKTRALISSEEYTSLFPNVEILSNQDQKTHYQTTMGGWRLATSVGGHGTGEHPDRVVCFPYEELVGTEEGYIPIGELVEGKVRVRVRSWDPENNTFVYQPITGWHRNPGSELVRVRFDNGLEIRCTPDHRILTRNRGWVEARDLRTSDVLPCTAIADSMDRSRRDSISSGKGSRRFLRACEDFLYSRFIQFASFTERSSRSIGFPWSFGIDSSNDLPGFAPTNLVNRCFFDVIEACKRLGRTITITNFEDFLVRQFSVGSAFSHGKGAMSLGIFDVLFSCPISKVVESIVRRIAIEVANFMSFWAGTNESQHDLLMDPQLMGFSLFAGIEPRILAGLSCGDLEDLILDGVVPTRAGNHATMAQDTTMGGNAVQALETNHCSPLFVRHGGYAPVTYCLSVKDCKNFTLGSQYQIVVSNCDDPHNVKQAESEVERQAVLDWCDLTMSTRGIVRDVRWVIIMQRLHERDFTAHNLKKGGFYHLCLPMRWEAGRESDTPLEVNDPRTKEGELLMPQLFTEEVVSKLERDLGPYGVAGQLQQRPQPRGGGMFKIEFFNKRLKAAPLDCTRIRFWDRASTLDGGCYTAGVLIAKDRDGMYYVEHCVHGQWDPPERNRVMRATALRDRTKYGPRYEPRIMVEREGGSSGRDAWLGVVRALEGFAVKEITVTGSKDLRAEPWSAQLAAGNVIMIEDGTWDIDNYINEHCAFKPEPGKRLGKYKDQVDASCLLEDSLISTKRGSIPICEVTTEDEVLTRHGYERVLWSGCSGKSSKLVCVVFSDGSMVVATPEHRIWTEEDSWVAIDSLAERHTVLGKDQETAYPVLMFFITKVKTGTIIRSKILNALLRQHDIRESHDFPDKENTSSAQASWQQLGMELKKVLHGIANSARKPGKDELTRIMSVSSVARLSDRVVSRLQSIVRRFATNGTVDVYDLSVERNHEFFADGILVHNSGGFNQLTGVSLTGQVRVFNFGTTKKARLRILVCNTEELMNTLIDEHHSLLVSFQDPLPFGDGSIPEHGLSRLLGTKVIHFVGIDLKDYQDRWTEPIQPYNQTPDELVMTRDHGKKLWGFLTKKREKTALFFVFHSDNIDRAMSAALGVCEVLHLAPKETVYRPGEAAISEKPGPIPHVYDVVRSTRNLVL